MDGQLVKCESCGTRMGHAVAMCPRCATPFPGGLKGLNEYMKVEHHTLRLAGLVVMWAWMVLSVTGAIAFTGLFIARLG